MKIISAVLLITFTLNLQAIAENNYKKLAKHERWLRLLHYRKTLLSSRKSIIDNHDFFLSKNGAVSTYDELIATLKYFKSLKYDKNRFHWHPQCAFPARFKFLKQNTKEIFPSVTCKDFDWWKERISAKSISLVFSSYYKGNPASMFGHTLIKFNTDEGHGKISDFTFNFAANVGDEKGLTYIVKGLLGGFRGIFSTEPYYVKINDYIQGESRDVWEYLLKLSPDEVDWVVRHVWEIKTNAIFDYYFLDENCSYILLAILDVAKLDWNTSRGFFFYTLPVTTIKRVSEVNGIKNVLYRPSFRKKMMERVRVLTNEENKQYFKLLNKKLLLNNVKNKKVVEAYTAYLRYIRYEEGDDGKKIKGIKNDLRATLIFRAGMGGKTTSIDKAIEKRNFFDDPRKSHKTYTLGYQLGYHNIYSNYFEFNFRFGVHDIMNNGLGLPRYSNIDVLSFKPRYYFKTKKIQFEKIIFIDMLTLIDFDNITKDTSWGIRISYEKPSDFITSNSLLRVRPVYGISKYFNKNNLNLFLLALGDFQYGKVTANQNFRIGPGLQFGSISYLNDKFKLMIYGELIYDFLYKFSTKTRKSAHLLMDYSFGQTFEMKGGVQLYSSSNNKNKLYSESSLSAIYFF